MSKSVKKKKVVKKKPTLVARGIRFSSELWDRITKDAENEREYLATPSEVVRTIVEDYYKNKDAM